MAFNLLADKLCVNEPEENIQISSKMRKLFKLAGKVRDLQVQLTFFQQFKDLEKPEHKRFVDWLQSRQNDKLAKFGRSPHAYIHHSIPPHFHETIRLTLAQSQSEEVIHCANEVLASLENHISEFKSATSTHKNMHTLRKKVKQLRYLNMISHDILPATYVVKYDIEMLKSIETVAGKWHDRVVGCKMLATFIHKHTRSNSLPRKNLMVLYEKVKMDTDAAFDESKRFLDSLLG